MNLRRRPVKTARIPPKPVTPHLFLDLETLPTNDPWVISKLEERIKMPGTIKKPESIAEWEENEKPKLVAEAVSKTSFNGTYGRVCCISFAFNDLPAETIVGPEREVLSGFFTRVNQEPNPMGFWTMVGHNLRDFDMRFLWQRTRILNLPPSPALPLTGKRYDDHIKDTMLMWDPDISKRASLDTLCHVFGIDSPKDGFDGSMVAAAYEAGQYQRIAAYGAGDVEAVRQVYWRMVGLPTPI